MRTKRYDEPPALPWISSNGPDPTTGWLVLAGSLEYVLTPFSLTFFQMCSGMIGIGSSGSTALGLLSFRTTVVALGAVILVTEVRYEPHDADSLLPWRIRL